MFYPTAHSWSKPSPDDHLSVVLNILVYISVIDRRLNYTENDDCTCHWNDFGVSNPACHFFWMKRDVSFFLPLFVPGRSGAEERSIRCCENLPEIPLKSRCVCVVPDQFLKEKTKQLHLLKNILYSTVVKWVFRSFK